MTTPLRNLPASLLAVVALVAAVASMSSGCQPSTDTASGAAESFLDAHYVLIDLEASRALSVGVAREKIEEEVRLTSEINIESDTRQPSISYSRHFVDEQTDLASYEYELRISAGGGVAFTKRVLLTVRRGLEGWRVSNYSESDSSG